VARKSIAKKLKVTETTSQEVNSSSRLVEYLSCNVEFRVLAGDSAFGPRRPRDEGDWETVGEPAERRLNPAPAVEELVSQRSTTEVEPQVPVAESKTEPAAAPAVEEPAATEAEKEAPAEAELVDIASTLGAPTVTVVRSSL
jgi:hypothetical protein